MSKTHHTDPNGNPTYQKAINIAASDTVPRTDTSTQCSRSVVTSRTGSIRMIIVSKPEHNTSIDKSTR
jgi:hypothetical protein